MDHENITSSMAAAREIFGDESSRTRAGFSQCQDPATQRHTSLGMDLETLKRKFTFLSEYSDQFINATGVDILIKAETASRKLQKLDKERKAEDKLYQNRETLATTPALVPGGVDNRLDILHEARFLPGATCSAAKIWLEARKAIGGNGPPPCPLTTWPALG